MRLHINADDTAGRPFAELLDVAREAEAQGFAGFAIPQIFGLDAITTLALVGREVPRLELQVAVVPTYTRHPVVLAQQALTAQAVTGGRFVLGVGLSHQWVIENMFGLSFDRQVRHLREYLAVLLPLLREGSVSYAGETLTVNAGLQVAESTPCPVIVAALGPKMLDLAGTVADGTVTWMTGPATLEQHTIPALTAAAERAGRPAPRVVVSLPVCVTDDVAGARERAAQQYAMYGMLPSYRAMLDREGAADPGAVSIVGDEAAVRDALLHLDAIGVTDFAAAEYGTAEERARTRAVLRALL